MIAISLDAEKPPLGYRQFHYTDFSRWSGAVDDPLFLEIRDAIGARIDAAPPSSSPSPPLAPTPNGVSDGAAAAPGPPLRRPGVLGAIAALALAAFAAWFFLAKPSHRDGETIANAEAEEALQTATESQAAIGLAVLPFANLSSDPEQEHFADGLTEELLNWLGNVEGLRVPGRTTAFAYKGQNVDLREVGADLGVDYILEGSVRRADDA